MQVLSFIMNKHSLRNSMALRNRLVLKRKLATVRPIEMACITSSTVLMLNASVRI